MSRKCRIKISTLKMFNPIYASFLIRIQLQGYRNIHFSISFSSSFKSGDVTYITGYKLYQKKSIKMHSNDIDPKTCHIMKT